MAIDLENVKFQIAKSRFGLKTRISLYERLIAFLSNNVPLVNALRRINRRYEKNKDFRSTVLLDWIARLEAGGTFGDAIKEWVPPAEHMLISSAEDGKGVAHGLKEAVVVAQAAAFMKKAVVEGASYPVALGIMLILMVLMFQYQMVPVFANMLPIEEWTPGPKGLYDVSAFLKNNLVFLGVFGAALVFTVAKTMGSFVGPLRKKVFDRLPPWSIYRAQQGNSFLIALASMMSAGVPVYDCLRRMSKSASPWMQEHLAEMLENMERAEKSVGASLATGLLEDETAGNIEDFAELGNFNEAIQKIGAESIQEGVELIKGRMGVFKNVMMFGVMLVLMWIYYSTYELQNLVTAKAQQGAGSTGIILKKE